MKSLFEQNGGTYRKQGDYFVPNLTLSESEENNIGVYGQRHLRYLQEHRKLTYINLHLQAENSMRILPILTSKHRNDFNCL